MKNVKTSLLILTIGSSLALATLAGAKPKTTAAPATGTNYTLNAVITNNPPPSVVIVSGTPFFTGLTSNGQYGVVYTDGSGKLDGVQDLVFTNLSLGPFSQADFITDIGGSISTVGKTNGLVVNMTMKGNGYAQDTLGGTQDQASLNVTFKSSGGVVSNVSQIVTTTNVIELYTNIFSGQTNINGSVLDVTFTNVVTNNYYVYYPYTNISLSPTYQELYFLIHDSYFTTNTSPTTISVSNIVYLDGPYPFGPTLSTNGEYSFRIWACKDCYATNIFTNVVIAWSSNYVAAGTNAGVWTTNSPVYGVDISQISNFIADYLAAGTNTYGGLQPQFNVYTNTFYPNYREVELVPAVYTNTVVGSGNSYTNITLFRTYYGEYVNLPYSNGWITVNGKLNGKIAAGKNSVKYSNTAATLSSGPYTLYSTFTGTGGNTNIYGQFGVGPTNGTDSGVLYVASQYVNYSSIQAYAPMQMFNSTIKQFGKSLWVSGGGNGFGLKGTGSLNPAKDSYKASIAGVGRVSGSSLVVTGATGPLIVNYTLLTNIVSVTNLAALSNIPDGGLNPNDLMTAVFTNYTFLTNFNAEFVSTVTNVNGGVSNIVTTDISEPIAPNVVPNLLSNAITTIFGNGKVFGQKVAGSGTNAAVPAPTNP